MAYEISSTAVGVAGAILLYPGGGAALHRSAARAAVAAFHEAETNYQPIKRLLPEQWISMGAANAAGAREVLPRVQQFIDERGPHRQRTAAQRTAAQRTAQDTLLAQIVNLPQLAQARCAGCNQLAQGLRKCSRCRRVGYCR